MRRQGWFRLWIVVSVLFVPAVAIWGYTDDEATWKNIDRPVFDMCLDKETNLPSHPDAFKCVQQAGALQTVFEHEHISPRAYWARALGFAFLFDLILTGLLVAAFLVVRWIIRGFRSDAPASKRD